MINSIQNFQQKGIKKIQKVFETCQNDFSKMVEDAVARILEEAASSTYRKGGEHHLNVTRHKNKPKK